MPTRFIFVRHAKSIAHDKDIVQGQGLLFPLGEEGRDCAVRLAEALKDYKFKKIFSSTSVRAIQTTQIVAEFHPNTPIEQIAELNERSKGAAEGLSREEFNKQYGYVLNEWSAGIDSKPEGWESMEDLHKRVMPVFEKHTKNIMSDNDENFLYVTHGNVIRTFLGNILQIPFPLRGRIAQDYCAITIASYSSEKMRWTIECINKGLF